MSVTTTLAAPAVTSHLARRTASIRCGTNRARAGSGGASAGAGAAKPGCAAYHGSRSPDVSSTMIGRACYNEAQRAAVIQVRSTYRQFCDMPKATFDALLDAPSMGQFYLRQIRGTASGSSYACPNPSERRG